MKKTKMTTTTSGFPDEIYMEILSNLPGKSVMRFRSVSKGWNILLTSPEFFRLHFYRSRSKTPNLLLQTDGNDDESPVEFKTLESEFVDDDEFQTLNFQLPSEVSVLGSCNGIFCLLSVDNDFMSFLNPSTGENIRLQIAIDGIQDLADMNVYAGFGYVGAREEYKVVLIAYSDVPQVAVFNSGTNSWNRPQGNCPVPTFNTPVGVHVDGVIHWLRTQENFSMGITSFNLTNDEFGEIPLPDFGEVVTNFAIFNREYKLHVLDGSLVMTCLFLDHFMPQGCDIWRMKKSWERVCSIQKDLLETIWIQPIVTRKNGEILLLMGGGSLCLYDPVANTTRDPDVLGVSEQFSLYTYLECLTPIPPLLDGN